jgi:hypothetical protein
VTTLDCPEAIQGHAVKVGSGAVVREIKARFHVKEVSKYFVSKLYTVKEIMGLFRSCMTPLPSEAHVRWQQALSIILYKVFMEP